MPAFASASTSARTAPARRRVTRFETHRRAFQRLARRRRLPARCRESPAARARPGCRQASPRASRALAGRVCRAPASSRCRSRSVCCRSLMVPPHARPATSVAAPGSAPPVENHASALAYNARFQRRQGVDMKSCIQAAGSGDWQGACCWRRPLTAGADIAVVRDHAVRRRTRRWQLRRRGRRSGDSAARSTSAPARASASTSACTGTKPVFYELLYSTQSTSLDSDDPRSTTSTCASITCSSAARRSFAQGQRFWLPYLSLTIGATRFEPQQGGYDSETKFSGSLGGGFRFPFNDNVAREPRPARLPDVCRFRHRACSASATARTPAASCKSSGSTFFQGEAQLGLSVRF